MTEFMTEPRTITVEPVDPRWRVHDREVSIELWHNPTQSSALRLSREEARNLQEWLAHFMNTTQEPK